MFEKIGDNEYMCSLIKIDNIYLEIKVKSGKYTTSENLDPVLKKIEKAIQEIK